MGSETAPCPITLEGCDRQECRFGCDRVRRRLEQEAVEMGVVPRRCRSCGEVHAGRMLCPMAVTVHRDPVAEDGVVVGRGIGPLIVAEIVAEHRAGPTYLERYLAAVEERRLRG